MAYEKSETGNLIGSDKVEGTAVYGSDQQQIGSIERVMIDKISGKSPTQCWVLEVFLESETITTRFRGNR